MFEQHQGKALVVDAGNALFRNTGLDDEASKKRARFILQAMGELGTAVMAVGARDLGAGLPFLKDAAKGSRVKLLSANLREAGKPVFEASTVLTLGKTRVGVIGVSPASTGIPPLVAAQDEAKKLRSKVEVLVVLAAVPYADALQLSTELKDRIDFIFQSSDARVTMPQLSEGNVVIGSGERGRSVGKLDLTLSGKGPWVNADQAASDKALLDSLDTRIKDLKERRKAVKDAKAAAEFDSTLAEFARRRVELQQKANAAVAPGARAFKLEWVALDAKVGDDEQLKARVLEFEPTYAAPH